MGLNKPDAEEGSLNRKSRTSALGALALAATFLTGCGQKLPPQLLKICGMETQNKHHGREQSALDPTARIPMKFQRVSGPITIAVDPSTGTPEDVKMLEEAVRSVFVQKEMRHIGHSLVLVPWDQPSDIRAAFTDDDRYLGQATYGGNLIGVYNLWLRTGMDKKFPAYFPLVFLHEVGHHIGAEHSKDPEKNDLMCQYVSTDKWGGYTSFEEQWLRAHARGLDDTTPIKAPELSESHWAPIADGVRTTSFEVDADGHAVGWGLVAGLKESKLSPIQENNSEQNILHFDMAFYFGRWAEKTHNIPENGYRPWVKIDKVDYPLEVVPESGGRVWRANHLPIHRKGETVIKLGYKSDDPSFNIFLLAQGVEQDSAYAGKRGAVSVHVETKNQNGKEELRLGIRTPPRWTNAHSVSDQILKVLNNW